MGRATTKSWVEDYYAAVDQGDVDAAIEYFLPDSVMRFANEEPFRGIDAIEARTRQAFELFAGLRHDLKHIWEPEDGTVVIELDVTYIKKDGEEITVSGSLFGQIEPGRWVEQRIYADLAPVFA